MSYRKYWLPEILSLLALGLISTVPFWLSPLDLTVASWFYLDTNSSNSWPLKDLGMFRFLFWLAPWLTVALGLTGLLVLTIGILQNRRFRFRIYGLYIFLAVVVGPGLVVNALFKDHWDRPRPREVQVFGGEELYVPPLVPGQVGNSFPCGHCSVAFAFAAFYFIFRRRYPGRAITALLISIILGSLMGAARIAAGGHFLSDVLWSAVLTWSTLFFLYWLIMQIPLREDRVKHDLSRPQPKFVTTAKVLLIILVAVTGVVFTWRMY